MIVSAVAQCLLIATFLDFMCIMVKFEEMCNLLVILDSTVYDSALMLRLDVSGWKNADIAGYCKTQHSAFGSCPVDYILLVA